MTSVTMEKRTLKSKDIVRSQSVGGEGIGEGQPKGEESYGPCRGETLEGGGYLEDVCAPTILPDGIWSLSEYLSCYS